MLGFTRKTEEEKNIYKLFGLIISYLKKILYLFPTHLHSNATCLFFKLKFIYIEMALQKVFQDLSEEEKRRRKKHLQKGQLMLGFQIADF